MISLERRFKDNQYDNCISLGWFCGTASSLSKLGLRSYSGPFDWCFSHFGGVIDQIENGFKEFMLKENLKIDVVEKKIFHDVKYGFEFRHDIENSFEDEYVQIYEKYMRRVRVFKEMIIRPTTFFRCVRDNEEVVYINNNWARIDELIKSFNSENQIIYVCCSSINGLTDEVKLFVLNSDCYIGEIYEMFDDCPELIAFCDSLIDTNKRQKNIAFDNMVNMEKEAWAYINKCVEENIDDLRLNILETLNVTDEEGFYLWGAGQCGVLLAGYLRDRNVTIRAIVDNQKAGEVCEGIQIKTPDCIEEGAKILIAIVDKGASDSIERQINMLNIRAQIAKIQELVKKFTL